MNNDFLKKSAEQNDNPITKQSSDQKNPPIITINDSLCERESESTSRRSIKITETMHANIATPEDEDMIKNIITVTPKVSIVKMPSTLLNNGNSVLYSSSKFNKVSL